MNKAEFLSHSSSNLRIVTPPARNIISECNAHMKFAKHFSRETLSNSESLTAVFQTGCEELLRVL